MPPAAPHTFGTIVWRENHGRRLDNQSSSLFLVFPPRFCPSLPFLNESRRLPRHSERKDRPPSSFAHHDPTNQTAAPRVSSLVDGL